MVIDVSAMLVARTTFRFPAGVGAKTRIWASDGSAAKIGQTTSSGTPLSGGSSRAFSRRTFARLSISSCPVRNTRMSPLSAGSSMLIWSTVSIAASR